MSSLRYDHVFLISLDTLRSDAIAVTPDKAWPKKYDLGERTPRTPRLDALATQGLFFPNTLSAAPYTSASHASFFTGLWPAGHGVYEFFNRSLSVDTVFTWARRSGYRTRFKVDFPIILGKFLGFDRDVDHYIVEDDEALLASFDKQIPSFNFVHFGGLHIPYGFHNLRYGGDAYRATVESLEKRVSVPPIAQLADRLVETYRDPEDLELLLRYKRAALAMYAEGRYRELMQLYLDGIDHFLAARFDPFLERLMTRLEGTRSLIVLFGDHGEEYDEHSCGHFNSVAHGVLRVPLILWGADLPPRVHAGQVRAIDLAPTLVELLGWPGDLLARMDGRTLIGGAERTADPVEPIAFAQSYVADTGEFVRYQQRLMGGGSAGSGLRHVRYREVVYGLECRLTRQNFLWEREGFRAISPIRSLERPGPAGWSGFSNLDLEQRLERALNRYNARISGAPGIEAPAVVRQQLADMGYRV